MSSFERYMVNRLDGFAENPRNLHDLCVSNFQNIDNRFNSMDACFMTLDEQIEVVQNHIFFIYNMPKMTKEEKQSVDITEQPIILCVVSVFCFCSLILYYLKQLSLYLLFLSICEDK